MPQIRKHDTNTSSIDTPILSQAGCSHTHAVLLVGPPADDRQAGSADGAASPLANSPPPGGGNQGKDLPASDGVATPSARGAAQAAAAPSRSQACGNKRPRPDQCRTPDVTKDRPPWWPDVPLPPPPTVPEGQPTHAVQAQGGGAADAASRQNEVSQTLPAFTLCAMGACHSQTMLSGYEHTLLCCSPTQAGPHSGGRMHRCWHAR